MSKMTEIDVAESKGDEHYQRGEYTRAAMWYSSAKSLAEDIGNQEMVETYENKRLECQRLLEENRQQFLQD